jgi:uroporphyrinogen decarboxylase
VGVDWRIELDEAWRMIGDGFAVQGNLDPLVLLGPQSTIRGQVQRILGQANQRPGHIFNLGHGIVPETPVENVVALVEMVHELSQRQPRG